MTTPAVCTPTHKTITMVTLKLHFQFNRSTWS